MKDYQVIITKKVTADNPDEAIEKSAAIVPSRITVYLLGQVVYQLDSEAIDQMLRSDR